MAARLTVGDVEDQSVGDERNRELKLAQILPIVVRPTQFWIRGYVTGLESQGHIRQGTEVGPVETKSRACCEERFIDERFRGNGIGDLLVRLIHDAGIDRPKVLQCGSN